MQMHDLLKDKKSRQFGTLFLLRVWFFHCFTFYWVYRMMRSRIIGIGWRNVWSHWLLKKYKPEIWLCWQLLAEIAVEEKDKEVKSRKDVLSSIVQERMNVNRSLKQRGLEMEVKNQLLTHKASIQVQEVEARKIEMIVIFSWRNGKQHRKLLLRKRRKYGRNEDEARNIFVKELRTIFSLSTMLVCHLTMEVIWKDSRLGDWWVTREDLPRYCQIHQEAYPWQARRFVSRFCVFAHCWWWRNWHSLQIPWSSFGSTWCNLLTR